MLGTKQYTILRVWFSQTLPTLVIFSLPKDNPHSQEICTDYVFQCIRKVWTISSYTSKRHNIILNYKPIAQCKWTCCKISENLQLEARWLTTATSSHQDLVKAFLLVQKNDRCHKSFLIARFEPLKHDKNCEDLLFLIFITRGFYFPSKRLKRRYMDFKLYPALFTIMVSCKLGFIELHP